jgi:hypothetical protein
VRRFEKNVLAKELECLISSMPGNIFDVKFIRTRYGEGSDVSKTMAKAEEET